MFKKTLLALAVAGTSLSASAGILTVDVKEGTNTAAHTAVTNIGTKVNGCALAATALSVTANTATFTPDNTAGDDTINIDLAANETNVYSTTSSVTYTGNNACTVVLADELVTSTTAKYSLEGATAKGVEIDAKQIAGIGGFSPEDTITFTVTGGTINEAESLKRGVKLTSDGANGGWTLKGVVGNTIIFISDDPYTAKANEILTLENVVVTPDAGVDGVTVSSEAQNTSNVKYDTSAPTKLANLAKQYSATVHVKGDGIVDVQEQRLLFADNTNDSSDTFLGTASQDGTAKDTFVVKVTENTTLGNLTPKTGTVKVTGKFDWLMDYAGTDGKLSSAEIASAITYKAYDSISSTTGESVVGSADDTVDATKYALNTEMTELTITLGTGADADIDQYHAFSFKPKGTTGTSALSETDFTADIEFINDKSADVTSADVKLNVASAADVASWRLNGSVVNVPYIPFGPNTQPIIRHTNKGVQTGDISLRYMVEGSAGNTETNTWKSLGIIVQDAKPGVRDLLSIVTEKLTAELGTDKFKVALEITTNVPKEDVTVFAAAKITAEGQDRLTIGAFSGQ